MNKIWAPVAASLILAACSTKPLQPSPAHLGKDSAPPSSAVPAPVTQTPVLPPPRPAERPETYSVVVNNVPVQELLFALARDAKLNVDIHPGLAGSVTLNAINQTLPQILNRIAKQVDMRYEVEKGNLMVMPDTPYLRNYKIDYLNMSRNTDSRTSISTQVASTGGSGQGTTGGGSAAGGSGNSNSTTQVVNKSSNQFWDTLVQNVKDILRETDKLLPEGSSITTTQETSTQSTTGTGAAAAAAARARATAPANLAGSPNPAAMATEGERVVARVNYREAASVIANAETGVLAVRATSKQHEKIQEFLDRVLSNARRQVLIEATVIQVQLSDQYQQGIDWSVLRHGSSGFTFRQAPVGNPPPSVASGLFTLGYAAPNSPLANISATIQLLETFGTLKVLSSPKISVLNNQTALLKVVQNLVYFNIQVTPGTTSAGGQTTQPTYTTTAATVPVGFVMSVTPHISDSDEVTLNVRPTISRRIRDVPDPNPALRLDANGNALPIPAVNNVPVIETKEMESILKISSGQIAVMGGLMEDVVNNTDNRVPGLADLPVVGSFFNYKDNISSKSELVIFLRPIVVKDASLSGDYSSFTSMLPGPDYFKEDPTRGVVRKP